ncbi:uncharacterized protein LOC133721689 [Rosa rugosa]|uniref:uncharacterized protein LOC133721689 n=1 Tax=Rosa rugosa TaxID=74645 RepID=UPI002B40D626|nr:uncharacterized protein LOC133721689 [Rosa rugosa]
MLTSSKAKATVMRSLEDIMALLVFIFSQVNRTLLLYFLDFSLAVEVSADLEAGGARISSTISVSRIMDNIAGCFAHYSQQPGNEHVLTRLGSLKAQVNVIRDTQQDIKATQEDHHRRLAEIDREVQGFYRVCDTFPERQQRVFDTQQDIKATQEDHHRRLAEIDREVQGFHGECDTLLERQQRVFDYQEQVCQGQIRAVESLNRTIAETQRRMAPVRGWGQEVDDVIE